MWASFWTFPRASPRPFPQPTIEGAKTDPDGQQAGTKNPCHSQLEGAKQRPWRPDGQHPGTKIARFILGSLWRITFRFSSWPMDAATCWSYFWFLPDLFLPGTGDTFRHSFPNIFFGCTVLQWPWSNCYFTFSNGSAKSRLQCDHPLRARKPAP